MKNLTFIIFLAFSTTLLSQDFTFTVAGNWMNTISPSDIIEAGNDYPTSYESNTNQTLLSITPTSNGKTLYVYVTRSDIKWHNDLILQIKRNTSGNNSSVSGDTMYQVITNASPPSNTPSPLATLFTCKGAVTSMNLQYKITGISVLLPVDSYSTTITYTVMH